MIRIGTTGAGRWVEVRGAPMLTTESRPPDMEWGGFTARARHYWQKSNNCGELTCSLVRIMHDTHFGGRISVLAE
ncbi:MAG: hypothetical protein ABIG68_15055, partial [Acidobacteriota bacterium]